MVSGRWMAGIATGVVATAGMLAAPAVHAQNSRELRAARDARVDFGSIGGFTPAAADPKLAAVLARSGLNGDGFRFTPSTRVGNRNVTVAVRARTARSQEASAVAAVAPTVTLAPIAYNLGMSVGWKRFAVSGDLAKIDLGAQPGSREAIDLGVSYTGKKFGGQVRATADRPLAGTTPRLVAEDPSYSIDVGGSYSLTRNLAVTAGVRYKSEEQRLPRLTDDRRDSQAVYVGTAFRF